MTNQTLKVEAIVAKAHSDHGVLVDVNGDSVWYNGDRDANLPSSRIKWAALFPKGKPVMVSYCFTKSGGRVIKAVLTEGSEPANPKPPVATESATKPEFSSRPSQQGRPLSDYDKRKDVSIRVSGILQAVVSSPALAAYSLNAEDFIKNVETITDALLEVADRQVVKRVEK